MKITLNLTMREETNIYKPATELPNSKKENTSTKVINFPYKKKNTKQSISMLSVTLN